MTLGLARNVGLGHLAHRDGSLDTSIDASLFAEVLQGKAIHDGAEHAHVVGTVTLHAVLLKLGPAEKVSPTDDDGYLDTAIGDLSDLAGLGGHDIGVNTDSSPSENLSGQLEKDSVIALWHHLSWSADIDAGCVTLA